MKTSTAVSAGAIGLALLVLPSFAHAQMRPTQLTWVDRTGKVIETVGAPGTYLAPEMAPDGKRVAVHRHDPTNVPGQRDGGDVVIFDGASSAGLNLTAQRAPEIDHSMPIWSPDGTRIVYGSTRSGKGGLYVRHADGSGSEELLIESETSKVPMSWSPDGKYIVYWSPGNIQWILPLTGDRKPFQLSPSATLHAQISPDGKWVAYQLSPIDADDEIFVKPFPRGSSEVQVSRSGGQLPRWSADGKEIIFLNGLSNGWLMAATMSVSGSKITAGIPSRLFESGAINQGHSGGAHHVFAVSPDGSRFLIPRISTSAADNPNARTLTVVDRGGNTVTTLSERGLYSQLAFSPDRTRVALVRTDPARNVGDVWVFDVATGKGTQLTTSTRDERTVTPVWSPDGRHIAYVVIKDDVQAIYRKLANGEGSEEHVHTLGAPGASLFEWTSDGRYITYYSEQLGGNTVYALPLSGDPKPVEVVRSQSPIFHVRLSPDNRFVAFRSPESGKEQIWVAPFDPSASSRNRVQVCADGCTAPVYWSKDGNELYYLSLDRGLMATSVRTESGFALEAPRLLFNVSESFAAGAAIGGAASMSRDGEQFVFAVPRTPPAPPAATPLPRITIVDRQGVSVQTLGEPGPFFQPVFSVDRSRVLVRKTAPVNGSELWAFDVATGKGTLITSAPIQSILWSRDGQHVFYAVTKPGGLPAIVQKRADDSGAAETIYEYTPGAPINIREITPDGRFLVFDSGGVIMLLPLAPGTALKREALEILREDYVAYGARFSPDGRTMAYVSDQTGRDELYVQSFDPMSVKLVGRSRQVTTDSADFVVGWRADGKELYHDIADLGANLVRAVDVSMTPTPRTGTPRLLFRATGRVTGDGQSFVAVLSPQNRP